MCIVCLYGGIYQIKKVMAFLVKVGKEASREHSSKTRGKSIRSEDPDPVSVIGDLE